MTLDLLLVRAGINRYDGWTWFRDAQLTGQTLQVAAEVEPTVRKCYLPQLRLIIPALALVSLSENRPSVVKRSTGWSPEGHSGQEPVSLFPEDADS